MVQQGVSSEAITYWSVFVNQENYLPRSVIEYMIDYFAQWWTDGCYFPKPSNDPLYDGIKENGLWELEGGTCSLPAAMEALVSPVVTYGAQVTGKRQFGSFGNKFF